MKRLIYAVLPLLLLVCCTKPSAKMDASVTMEILNVSSTGCEISVQMGEMTDYCLMALLPQSEYSPERAEAALASSARYVNELRVFERLSGEKNYVIVARPVAKDGSRGELASLSFTLTDMDLEVLLYTPGAGDTEQLNKYNTLNLMAFSNGIAAKLRCSLAVNEVWEVIKLQKGLKAAAEEVLSNSHVDFTKQMLEELANTDRLKRDILYFNPLEAGTKYTLVVCLEELDGESHYYAFDGRTEARP